MDRQIVPLESNALTLRMMNLAPGPDLALRRPEIQEAQGSLLETPSVIERRLRARVGQMVSTQVVEDGDGLERPQRNYHAYNAALKRVLGKGRGSMTLSELESAAAWLERNRLSNHLHLLNGDARYDWTRRQRRTTLSRPENQ